MLGFVFMALLGTAETEILLKLALSLALGMLIGLEREIHKKPAGMRTHTLVCVGATLFAVMSVSFVEDPARIAAGVVTGIGFLAAGSIFREERIHGLTTAADIWVIAAVGMAVGFGYYFFAVAATIISLAVLIMGTPFNKWIAGRQPK